MLTVHITGIMRIQSHITELGKFRAAQEVQSKIIRSRHLLLLFYLSNPICVARPGAFTDFSWYGKVDSCFCFSWLIIIRPLLWLNILRIDKVTCHNKSHITNTFVFPLTKGLLKELKTQKASISHQWFTFHLKEQTPLLQSAQSVPMTLTTSVRILNSHTIHMLDVSMSEQLSSRTIADSGS